MTQSYDRATFYGLDTTETRTQAQQMDANAENLGALVNDIGALMESVLWLGPGAQRFKADWDGSMRPQIQEASDTLRGNAAEMRRRADLQDQASA
ncbi:MAG TPA: hypothetical protein VKY71_08285 [Actinotalea caeni]|uniref:hypothetical protein n=1 Tax=Actinotalea caeni TaxID=1348467 RepID=UPI0012E2BAB1|nr:hypothetical protein [Actinotalea caeni]HLV55554.1 hypothetical protein [Actinotalea caeni]